MSEGKQNEEESAVITRNDMKKDKLLSVLSSTIGTIAGGVITAGPAMKAGGAAGVAGYAAGLGSLIAKIGGGGTFIAVSSLSAIAAGPILGSLIGYFVYKSIKKK